MASMRNRGDVPKKTLLKLAGHRREALIAEEEEGSDELPCLAARH